MKQIHRLFNVGDRVIITMGLYKGMEATVKECYIDTLYGRNRPYVILDTMAVPFYEYALRPAELQFLNRCYYPYYTAKCSQDDGGYVVIALWPDNQKSYYTVIRGIEDNHGRKSTVESWSCKNESELYRKVPESIQKLWYPYDNSVSSIEKEQLGFYAYDIRDGIKDAIDKLDKYTEITEEFMDEKMTTLLDQLRQKGYYCSYDPDTNKWSYTRERR